MTVANTCLFWVTIPFLILQFGILYFLIRNNHVFNTRATFWEDDFDGFKRLPSYDAMMLRYWWKWNWDEYRTKK